MNNYWNITGEEENQLPSLPNEIIIESLSQDLPSECWY